jgi:hypothetical protein
VCFLSLLMVIALLGSIRETLYVLVGLGVQGAALGTGMPQLAIFLYLQHGRTCQSS